MRNSPIYQLIILISVCLTNALGQISSSFFGSSQAFLNTDFCQQSNTCFASGVIKLADQSIEEYFSVKPREKQRYGQSLYTVFFTRNQKTNAIERAGIRYLAAQDYTEDGAFAVAFFSFVSGVPLHALDSIDLISGCTFAIRGLKTFFFLDSSTRLSFSNAAESFVVMYDGGPFASSWFNGASLTARVVRDQNCKQ